MKSLLAHPVKLLLQDAITTELYQASMYKHLANQCQRMGLFGAAKYFRAESAEELEHYQKHVDFINDRGSVAEVPPIEACTDVVTSLETALTVAYDAEVAFATKYSKWYVSLISTDPITAQYLLQFLEIQRSAVGTYGDWLSRVALSGGDKGALLIIDTEMGG